MSSWRTASSTPRAESVRQYPAEPRWCEWCGKYLGLVRGCHIRRGKGRFCGRKHAAQWRAKHNDEKRLEAVRAANAARAKYPAEERSCLVCGKSLGRIRGSRLKNGRGRFCGEHRYLWGRYKKLNRERKGKIVACPVPGCDVTRYLEPGELLRKSFTGLCRTHNGLTDEALRDLKEGRDEVVRHERELRIKLQEMDKVDPQTAAAATNVTPGNFHAALRHERAGSPKNGRPPVAVVTVENYKGTTVPRVVSGQLELIGWERERYGTGNARRRLAPARMRAKGRGSKVGRPRKLKTEDAKAKARELRAQGLGVRDIAVELGVGKSTVARFLRSDCPNS
jgi:hypothetical protein